MKRKTKNCYKEKTKSDPPPLTKSRGRDNHDAWLSIALRDIQRCIKASLQSFFVRRSQCLYRGRDSGNHLWAHSLQDPVHEHRNALVGKNLTPDTL